MTGVLQNYSRRNHLQIDMIKIDFEITKWEVETDHPAKLGAYIRVSIYFTHIQTEPNNLLMYKFAIFIVRSHVFNWLIDKTMSPR